MDGSQKDIFYRTHSNIGIYGKEGTICNRQKSVAGIQRLFLETGSCTKIRNCLKFETFLLWHMSYKPKQMERKVNLPVPIEKYGFNHKKLKSKWIKEVRRI